RDLLAPSREIPQRLVRWESSGREDASIVLSFKLTVSGHCSIRCRVSGAVVVMESAQFLRFLSLRLRFGLSISD
ncbi:hypothetical protein P692DRAFT_20103694, partial [Suillus brevipes Sb2]